MKFRRNAPLALIGCIVLVVGGMAVASNRLFAGLTRNVEEDQFRLMRSILEFNLRGAEGRALARAQMVADIPCVQQAFAARDRARLTADLGEMFRVQREQYGMDQLQFHLAPATSFLRLHAPTLHGDDLSAFRPMVQSVNEHRVARRGMEVARTGVAVFGVVPVHDAERRHLGTVEVGIDVGTVLDGLKAAYGLELAFLVDERPLREFATGLGGDVLSDQNRVGRYLKVHSTHWALMQRLVDAARAGNLTEPAQYTRESSNVPYGVLLMPVRNASGQPLGVMVLARDFSGSRAAAGRSLVWQVWLALCGVVLLVGAVLVVLRGMLLRPLDALNRRFAALAAGKVPEPMEDTESLCAELRDLADELERRRVARGGEASEGAAAEAREP